MKNNRAEGGVVHSAGDGTNCRPRIQHFKCRARNGAISRGHSALPVCLVSGTSLDHRVHRFGSQRATGRDRPLFSQEPVGAVRPRLFYQARSVLSFNLRQAPLLDRTIS